MTSATTIGAVILAAGGSSRLGEPKQFVLHHGQTLLRRAVVAANDARCSPIAVVAGDHWQRITSEARGLGAVIVHHSDWHRGIGSSVRVGVTHVLQHAPHVMAILMMVCDQPFVSADVLTSLIAALEISGKSGAACRYAGTTGVPALFGNELFPELLSLSDDEGAKQLLRRHSGNFAIVDFPEGSIDIDTPADLAEMEA